MPFIRTTTNKHITESECEAIKSSFGKSISLVSGKAECYLMISIEDGAFMAYQGDFETPCAMVEVQLLGKADPKELESLTAAITKDLSEIADISPSRIYVNYTEFTHWGASGRNF